MLVYGFRLCFRENVRRSYGFCEECDEYRAFRSYRAYRFLHLYFIPLIPVSGRIQVLRECSKCKTGRHLTAANATAEAERMEQSFKSWVELIAEGQRETVIQEGSPPVNIGILIAEQLDDLVCLDILGEIDSLCELITESEFPFEHWIIRARWAGICGDLSESLRFYKESVKASPNELYAVSLLGTTAMLAGEPEIAQQAVDAYSAIRPEDPTPFLMMIEFLEKRKDYSGVVTNMDRVFELQPALLAERRLAKTYKRACKKSGLGGKFLARV